MTNMALPRSARPLSLLFPVEPQPYETLIGFVVRCISRNFLGTPVQFMKNIGCDIAIKGDYLRRLQEELPAISDAVGVPINRLEMLWGAIPPDEDGARRMGGVYLRPSLIEQSRRRVPPSIRRDQPDDARWMIRPVNFCSRTWEALIDQCPNKWCGRTLTWPQSEAMDRCRHCATPLSEAKREIVPQEMRYALSWLISLFSESPSTRQTALNQVPLAFSVKNETEVFELLLALRRALLPPDQGLRKGEKEASAIHGWSTWKRAVDFMLDFPKSLWDMRQDMAVGQLSHFTKQVQYIRRNSTVRVVQQNITSLLTELNQPDPLRSGSILKRANTVLTTRELAQCLGVPPDSTSQLVEAKLLVPLVSSGKLRKRHLFRQADARLLLDEFEQRISWRSFSIATKFPRIAIEQLLSVGALLPFEGAATKLLFGERQLEATIAHDLIDRLGDIPFMTAADAWPTIEQVFCGVGGREKPWAPVIMAAANGNLGGLVARSPENNTLRINPLTAQQTIMGGPDIEALYRFSHEGYGRFWRELLKPGEVATHLNCTLLDLSFLVDRNHLWPEPNQPSTLYNRGYVSEFSKMWMTTREAAARLGMAPRDIWQVLERQHLRLSLGHGFHNREELEGLIVKELEHRTVLNARRRYGPRAV